MITNKTLIPFGLVCALLGAVLPLVFWVAKDRGEFVTQDRLLSAAVEAHEKKINALDGGMREVSTKVDGMKEDLRSMNVLLKLIAKKEGLDAGLNQP